MTRIMTNELIIYNNKKYYNIQLIFHMVAKLFSIGNTAETMRCKESKLYWRRPTGHYIGWTLTYQSQNDADYNRNGCT